MNSDQKYGTWIAALIAAGAALIVCLIYANTYHKRECVVRALEAGATPNEAHVMFEGSTVAADVLMVLDGAGALRTED